MENTNNMISLCESMIDFHKRSKSIFAEMDVLIWESKLRNWKSLLESKS